MFAKVAQSNLGEVTASIVETNATAIATLERGRQQYGAGQFSPAIATLEQAIQQASDQPLLQATALANLALAHRQMGNWTQAQKALDQAMDLLGRSPTTNTQQRILAQAWNTQGNLNLEQSQPIKAIEAFEKAETTYHNLPPSPERSQGLIRSKINQSKALQVQGFYRLALDQLADLELSIAEEADDQLAADNLRSLGDARASLGELTKAEAILKQSIERATLANSTTNLSQSQLSLGRILHTRWQTATNKNDAKVNRIIFEADQAYQKVLQSNPSDLIKAKSLINRFQLNQDANLPDFGLQKQIETTLAVLPPSRSSLNAQIKFSELLLKKVTPQDQSSSEAVMALLVDAVNQAHQLQDGRAESYGLGILGKLYEEAGQWPEAGELTEKALILAQQNNANDIAYQWQWQKGRILKAQGDRPQAMDAYDAAIQTLDELRSDLVTLNPELRFSFRQSIEPIYREAVSLLFELADEVGVKAGDKSNPERQTFLKRAQTLVESLQAAELVNFFRADCVLSLQTTVDESLQTNEALIYPILLGDRLEILLSRPNQPIEWQTAQKTATQAQVKTTVKAFKAALSNPANRARNRSNVPEIRQTSLELPDVLPSATKLYDWLIRPLEATLEATNTDTLVFVLDGDLRNIPMSALYDDQKEEYLIEKYAIAITPGLQLINPQPLADKQIKAVVGALSEARDGFPALSAVPKEVEQIRQQVGAEVLSNATFTKLNLEETIGKTSFPIVHLATHGKFSSSLEETFILAWDRRISISELSQLLQSSELTRKGVPIELLILSACETATGDDQAALGLAGVAVQAGARSTIASLWAVNDKGTSVLMSQLYQELGQLKDTKAMALRKAQLKLLREPEGIYTNPYFWAPFVLVGNWL
ncbi:MAG: tetratricopeptide repeat protein [Limnothrix sp. RL_2_0]|nr:tetratricopeptide repeat protein [Limnothrix sp. RL_2_0]